MFNKLKHNPRTALLGAAFILLAITTVFLVRFHFPFVLPNTDSSTSFSSYTDTLFTQEITKDTLSMHYILCDPSSFGINHYEVTLGHLSDDSDVDQCLLENIEARLSSYNYEDLSLHDQLTYDILKDYITHSYGLDSYALYEEPLRPQTGFVAEYPVLLTEYQFQSEQDIIDYLALLSCTPAYFDELIAFEEKKSSNGLFMSDTSADAVIAECSALTAPSEEPYLITTFNDKLDTISGLSSEDKTRYTDKNAYLVQKKLFPAYNGLADSMSHLKGTGKNEYGLAHLPDGKKYYEQLVYQSTGSSYSVSQLMNLTHDARNQDLLAISDLLTADPNLSTETLAESCTFSKPEDTLSYLSSQITDQFPTLPDTSYSVKYVDPCMQDSMAPAFYLTAPIDDPGHNNIYVNPASDYDALKLFTTLAHEGFPGHLYQTAYTAKNGIAPIRSLLNYPGYVEGWATYVELLSYSYAGLSPDAASLRSHHNAAILSLYASADMGIHYEGWTFKDTFNFFKNYGITDAATVAQIYHYIVEEPAHYLKYYVGYLEFLELKEYAKDQFGDDYTDLAFHTAVLRIGPAPFSIVKKYLPYFWES